MSVENVNIGSNTEIMKKELLNVQNSEMLLRKKYQEFSTDNESLVKDWKGDTAIIFTKYSKCMDALLNEAIDTTKVFGIDIDTFTKQSIQLDLNALINVER